MADITWREHTEIRAQSAGARVCPAPHVRHGHDGSDIVCVLLQAEKEAVQARAAAEGDDIRRLAQLRGLVQQVRNLSALLRKKRVHKKAAGALYADDDERDAGEEEDDLNDELDRYRARLKIEDLRQLDLDDMRKEQQLIAEREHEKDCEEEQAEKREEYPALDTQAGEEELIHGQDEQGRGIKRFVYTNLPLTSG